MTGDGRAAPIGDAYRPIGDYALLADGHAVALVSREASIDWCCLPRVDSSSCFGRLLDAERGGHCSVTPTGAFASRRAYVPDTMVVETSFRTDGGQLRVRDALVAGAPRVADEDRRLLRALEGERGAVEVEVRIRPRFDYGAVRPQIRQEGARRWAAIGGDDGLLVASDVDLERDGEHDLRARVTVRAGERLRLWIAFVRPALLDAHPPGTPPGEELDAALEDACATWRAWAGRARAVGAEDAAVRRSALTLRALTYTPTGAIAAAATTSLPETPGGERNWDYRYSWIRDSAYAVRALAEIGFEEEADAFRRFVERSAAGSAEELQVLFGVGGERRLAEHELDLEGYAGASPVRVGNGAAGQLQLDAFGELVGLTYRWHARGHTPDDDYWRFLVSLVDAAAERWSEPDAGLWEWRGDPLHFVHSKTLCWAALERGIRLAQACGRRAPTRRWARVRDQIAAAIEDEGYDRDRGVYVQAFGHPDLDAALLLLPLSGYVDWADERMVRTTDAIRSELGAGGGLLYRYQRDDGLGGKEGAFLACSFWLAECLARQGRAAEARAVYDAAAATANDVGLFSEEWDAEHGLMLGNLPQGLTHLSHIAAAVALAQVPEVEVAG